MDSRLENAQYELLREAERFGNQICKLKTADGEFVKVRTGYSHPEERRDLYMQALADLVTRGRLRLVLQNKTLELYEVCSLNGEVTSVRHALEKLTREIEEHGTVYKIHSGDGEYVQVGSTVYCDIEEERILFLEALCELVRHGKVEVKNDSCVLSRFELKRPTYAAGMPDSELPLDRPRD
ncbi:MAG: hypothetical protein ACRD3W_16210 [Terriglobales bacterium]